MTCDICGKRVERKGTRGPIPTRHPDCKNVAGFLAAVERFAATLEPGEDAEQFRYRLICIAAEIPRARDELGRFVGRKQR